MNSLDPRKLKFGKLSVKPRTPERVVLSNGLIAHLLEDHELPVVHFGALLRTGAMYDPRDKTGLASMTATAMQLGGSERFPGDALDEELDFLGAQLDGGADDDAFTVTGWCLKRHLPRLLDIFADVLRHPAFPPDKVELTRAQELEMIQRRWDQPSMSAGLMFRQQVYGKETVWGRLDSESTAKNISRDDMAAFHHRYFNPNAMIFAAAGDFTKKEMVDSLERVFSDWREAPSDLPSISPLQVSFPGGVYLVPRAIGQTNFRIGHLGTKLGHPDHFALKLMDMILGNGTFNSRLFRDIRTERGLAYSIWSRMSPRPFEVGTFQIGGETKYETAGIALGAILKHMRDLQAKDTTDEEIRLAKDGLENSFAFEFQSSWNIVWRQASYEYTGLPADWLFQEREKVLASTKKDIRRVAQAHLHPEGVIILVVGDPAKCRDTLATFGPVTELPIPDQPQ